MQQSGNQYEESREQLRARINLSIYLAWVFICMNTLLLIPNVIYAALGYVHNLFAAILIVGTVAFLAVCLNKFYKLRWYHFGPNGRRSTN